MKVKFISPSPKYTVGSEFGSITLGKVYECTKISVWKSAYILDDEGLPSMLADGEYEIIEDEQ